METKETVIDQKFQSNLNSLIENTLEQEQKMEEDLDFFFNNNASQPKKRKYEMKKIKPYNTARIKSRNFLTNISYNGVKEEDLFDRSFVFRIYVLTTKNINPFSVERKIFNMKDREMINMFWEDCNEPSFYKYIYQPDNFLHLNGKNVIYPRVAEIVMNYIETDENNFKQLKRKLIENQKIFQYVYASICPEVYSFVEKRGVDMRNNFHLKFKEWKDILKNQLTDIFPSRKIRHQPRVRFRKNLLRLRTLRKRKKFLRNKNKKKWKNQNQKKENVDVKLRQKTKNLKELRRQKRTKWTRKKCGQGSKN